MTVFTHCNMDGVKTIEVGNGRVIVHSQRSPFKTTPNEDAACVLPFENGATVLAVADGMGGAQAGDKAAAIAVAALEETVRREHHENYPLRAAIMDGIEAANERILQLGVGAATTLAVLEIQHRAVRPYHVGDSMILLVGARGKIKWQTVSHSPVGFAVEAGMLNEREAMHHVHRHLVSNVVGDLEMRIEIGPTIELAPRDRVLLASDGLFDNLHIEEVAGILKTGQMARSVEKMATEARCRMEHPLPGRPSKPDDLTVVAFGLKQKRRKHRKRTVPESPPENAQ